MESVQYNNMGNFEVICINRVHIQDAFMEGTVPFILRGCMV